MGEVKSPCQCFVQNSESESAAKKCFSNRGTSNPGSKFNPQNVACRANRKKNAETMEESIDMYGGIPTVAPMATKMAHERNA